ncbi:MAG: hypothetical protein FWC19_02280 [Treponema sp.]|nr:hypothetical protein [Treponema sp.]
MSVSRQNHFWGSLSPLGGLTGVGILIMASARLSWAVMVSASLFWVYALTSLSFSYLLNLNSKFLPKSGRNAILTCIASFWGSIYLFLFYLICPFAALEVFLLLMLVPLFCASSPVMEEVFPVNEKYNLDIFECLTDTVSIAAILSGLLITFSVIREPLAYFTLSFPGTYRGMILIIDFSKNSFIPVEIFVSSAGALILIGYLTGIYQYMKNSGFYGR